MGSVYDQVNFIYIYIYMYRSTGYFMYMWFCGRGHKSKHNDSV